MCSLDTLSPIPIRSKCANRYITEPTFGQVLAVEGFGVFLFAGLRDAKPVLASIHGRGPFRILPVGILWGIWWGFRDFIGDLWGFWSSTFRGIQAEAAEGERKVAREARSKTLGFWNARSLKSRSETTARLLIPLARVENAFLLVSCSQEVPAGRPRGREAHRDRTRDQSGWRGQRTEGFEYGALRFRELGIGPADIQLPVGCVE